MQYYSASYNQLSSPILRPLYCSSFTGAHFVHASNPIWDTNSTYHTTWYSSMLHNAQPYNGPNFFSSSNDDNMQILHTCNIPLSLRSSWFHFHNDFLIPSLRKNACFNNDNLVLFLFAPTTFISTPISCCCLLHHLK